MSERIEVKVGDVLEGISIGKRGYYLKIFKITGNSVSAQWFKGEEEVRAGKSSHSKGPFDHFPVSQLNTDKFEVYSRANPVSEAPKQDLWTL